MFDLEIMDFKQSKFKITAMGYRLTAMRVSVRPDHGEYNLLVSCSLYLSSQTLYIKNFHLRGSQFPPDLRIPR
jgi:hypothetical protein